MKSRLMFLLAMVVLWSAAAAVFTITEFSGTVATVGFVNPGTAQCPGGQATGQYPAGPPCSAGSRVNLRGTVLQQAMKVDDPRMTGSATVNWNINADGFTAAGPGSGPMWGTMSLEVSKAEIWDGAWTGYRTVNPKGEVYSTVHVVAHGSGGSIQGLKAEWDMVFTGDGSNGTASGWIVAPAGK